MIKKVICFFAGHNWWEPKFTEVVEANDHSKIHRYRGCLRCGAEEYDGNVKQPRYQVVVRSKQYDSS